ncbi:alkaline phosphatase [Winogradskyella sp. A3E31]|uniref:alkaline phosphatase n=1 Tax=Winogradskyella sp. A3E31 TaxID=3349637 RepID=UPI00398A6796
MKLFRLSLLSLVILFASCKATDSTVKMVEEKPQAPKNVILLIADGTGLAQISSAFYYKDSKPNYSRFNHIGLIQTSSSREDVTDSAAGATAFASGIKTYNGAIGVADDSTEVKTIVELISPKNIKTGVISTSSVVHATPACFYAHALSRQLVGEIAEDMVNSDLDFVAGGGTRFFYKRRDGKDLLKALRDKNFAVDTTNLSSFDDIKSNEKMAYILHEYDLPKMSEGRGDFLPNATELGIQFLNKDASNPNFFLMVEGSQVDWGGHQNDTDYLVSELIDFDNALGKALDFAEKDGNTLVIVTADHETGGFTLASTPKETEDGREYSDYSEITGMFSTGGHSASLIPVFAYGPGAEEFNGVYQNNDIFHKIMKVTGWK